MAKTNPDLEDEQFLKSYERGEWHSVSNLQNEIKRYTEYAARNQSVPAHSVITRADYEDYLIRLYFGSEADPLIACIDRAYLDFSRTLSGIRRLNSTEDSRDRAVDTLRKAMIKLRGRLAREVESTEFDYWHKATCEGLISIYKSANYHFYVGQAQKWVNMTLKYIYTFGEERIPGFGPAYPHCHMPLDNIILKKLAHYEFPKLTCAWSRLDDYDEYLNRQVWIRNNFSLVPLDVEFSLWLGTENAIKG